MVRFRLVCVIEQHYVPIFFFTFLWSVATALISDIQNPEISGFPTAHAYKYKNQMASKNEAKRELNNTFVPLYLKSEQCLRIINEWRLKRSVVLYTQTSLNTTARIFNNRRIEELDENCGRNMNRYFLFLRRLSYRSPCGKPLLFNIETHF